MKRCTEPRTLEHVERDLSYVVGDRTQNVLEHGRLLTEGKEFLRQQGAPWLPWLRRHTALHERTAQNYMKAAAWVDAWKAKYETVSYLAFKGIAPKALYLLASEKYRDDVVEKVLEAAASRPLNETDVKDIAEAGTEATIMREIEADQKAADEVDAKAAGFKTVEAWQAWLAEEEARWQNERAEEEARREAEQAEREAARAAREAEQDAAVSAILGGPPDPGLPPLAAPVAASSETFHVATLERLAEPLRSIMTKPPSMFTSAKLSPNDLEQFATFLWAVAKQIAEQRAA
jgi:hypothetical protein